MLCGWLGRSSYFANCVSISLVAGSFKHTNQVAVGGSRAKLLFPHFQRSSPGEERGHNNYYHNGCLLAIQYLTSTCMAWITVNGMAICVHACSREYILLHVAVFLLTVQVV